MQSIMRVSCWMEFFATTLAVEARVPPPALPACAFPIAHRLLQLAISVHGGMCHVSVGRRAATLGGSFGQSFSEVVIFSNSVGQVVFFGKNSSTTAPQPIIGTRKLIRTISCSNTLISPSSLTRVNSSCRPFQESRADPDPSPAALLVGDGEGKVP
jgi:hypothetical protein